VTPPNAGLRDVCRLLGGLALEGSRVELLRSLREDGTVARLGPEVGDDLAEALAGMQRALAEEEPEFLAAEYTRLMVADAEGGPRRPVPVPPWEDCYVGTERRVFGPRSRAALQAYVAAGLGYDGIGQVPADHVGLELCFVATLLDEEVRGERDEAARAAFVTDHLAAFSTALARAMTDATRSEFWRQVGRALTLLPPALAETHASGRGVPGLQ